MRIQLITPAARSRKGNWVTAERWARILRRLGHRVTIRQHYDGDACELMIALHAARSFQAVERFRRRHPGRPLILTLTGTDLYRDVHRDADARRALAWADRLIVLHEGGVADLAPELRPKTRVIRQSAVRSRARVARSRRTFDVCVVGHLREVKDPFRAAEAVRRLPAASKIRVLHAGAALDPGMERRARRETEADRRYRWLGDRPRWEVRRLLLRSRAMVLSSVMEGAANVVSEAIVAHLPVLSTRIPGSVGMLGEDHEGYFEPGDTAGLAALLARCETDPAFLGRLAARSRELAPLYDPAREEDAWRELLSDVGAGRLRAQDEP